MSDSAENSPSIRCEKCDTLNTMTSTLCIGCNALLPKKEKVAPSVKAKKPKVQKLKAQEPKAQKQSSQPPIAVIPPLPTSQASASKLQPLHLLTLLICAIALGLAFYVQQREPQVIETAALPTAIVEALATATATLTPFPTNTVTPSPTPTLSPTATATPLPTPTLEPANEHTIADGEFLISIALRYNVSIESIVALNSGLSADSITSGQTILVPQATATPPLQPVPVEINGETALADPTDCILHEVQEADTYFGIANTYNVTLDSIMLMNRLSEQNIARPGDTVCIPTLVYNVTTSSYSENIMARDEIDISQPRLLYPVPSTVFAQDEETITLQWIAERDLVGNEWYMVELTNLTDLNGRPQRAFTRQTSFQVPDGWKSADSAQMRWRIRFVTINGERPNGSLIYAYNGPSSESFFSIESE